ncbi:MAG TPA: hypothetical protein VEY93_04440, partial [Longimicrobium sp.]|nr:hypothetical protein [Longimicrobium sp.]
MRGHTWGRRTAALTTVMLAFAMAACGGGGGDQKAQGPADEGAPAGNFKAFSGHAPGGSLIVLA